MTDDARTHAADRIYGPGIVTLTILSAIALITTARLQFDWFDMSAFLDAGWRVAGGQEPYVDFFYIAQPVHLWMHAAFFRIFGFNQAAVLAHLMTVHVLFGLLLAWWTRRRLSAAPAFLVTASGIVAFSGPVAHPWYDQNATLWFLGGLVALESARARSEAVPLAVAGLLASLSFFTKANIGMGAFLAIGGQALLLPRPLRVLAWLAFGALGGTALVLALLADPMEFMRQAFIAYSAGDRLGNFVLLYDVLTRLPYSWCLLVALIAAVVAGRDWRRERRRDLVEVVLMAGAGIFGAYTGSLVIEAKGAFAGPMLAVTWALLDRLPQARRRIFATVIAIGTVTVLVQSLVASWPPRAWLWRPSSHESTYAMQHESFRGWKTAAAIGPGIDRAARYIEEQIPRDSSLLILPDATALYGMTGRQGYRGAPFLFHIGQVPPPGPDLEAFRRRLHDNPPDWILVHRQEEIPWCNTAGVIRWLELAPLLDGYDRVHADTDFAILRREENT